MSCPAILPAAAGGCRPEAGRDLRRTELHAAPADPATSLMDLLGVTVYFGLAWAVLGGDL